MPPRFLSLAVTASLALLATTATAARADRRWLRANFHAHAATEAVDDDGTESSRALHQALRDAGFDYSVHTPHCVKDVGPSANDHYAAQQAAEAALDIPGLTIAVGQELSLHDGPRFANHTSVLGHWAPGNLDHMTILGNQQLLLYRRLTPAEACDRAHQSGGICIVNHPGPGPLMWEDGYWEAPGNRGHIDALEVYNGQALAAVGIDFESRYREATAYHGLGLKIAATTGADTHGPTSVKRAQAKVAGFAGPARRLLSFALPQSPSARPELDAATLVLADSARTEDVIAAVKAHRTIATYALPGLRVSIDGLGEVRHGRQVHVAMKLSRKLAEITLYREGTAIQTWRDVDAVEWSEQIAGPTAYVFGARDGAGRLLTSAIWYEPR